MSSTKEYLNVKTPTVESIAKKHKVDVSVIQKQLEMGIKVEKEHSDNEKIAREIALDHLNEKPDYYTKLMTHVEELSNEDFSKMDTAALKKWITTRQRNAMGGNLSKKRGDQYDQARAELNKRSMKEELTTKTIRPTDKIKVARVIADMLGVEKAESMTPEAAINMGLRKVKNKRMTPELVGVLTKMLKLAQEVGVKVDMSLLPAAVKEETEDLQEMDKVVPVDSYTMAGDILRLKDYIALQKYAKAEDAVSKVGHGHHPVKPGGEDEEDQIRRMKVKYKTESVNTDQGDYHVNVTYHHGDDMQKVTKSYKIKNANDNRHASWKAMKIANSDAEKAGHKVKSMRAEWKKINEQTIDYDTEAQMKKADKATDKAELVLKHSREREAMAARHHNQKMALKKEEVELEEAAGQHKVTVTVSEPDHPMVTKRKETVMKRVIVSADNKDHAVVKAKEYYKKKGYKVHDAEYHSAQPKSSMATEETEQIDELSTGVMTSYKDKAEKAVQDMSPYAKKGEYKDIATNIIKRKLKGIATAKKKLGEEKKEEVPFEGGREKPVNVKDKSGAVHTAMSRARHLARMGATQQNPQKKDVKIAEDELETADYKTDKAGRKYRAHKIRVEEVEDNDFEILDLSDDEIENMVNSADFDDLLDVVDDEDVAIVDSDTGEEVEDDEEVNEEALVEVLSRAERMKAKIRFMRTKALRSRRVRIALKRRADAKTLTKRARRMAIKMLKQRLMKKPPSQMSVAEKERAERMIQQRRKIIDRLALRLVPKIRKMESERLAGKKAATPGVAV